VHDAYPLVKASHSSPSLTKARSASKKGHLPYEKLSELPATWRWLSLYIRPSSFMPARKLTRIQVLERFLTRLEKRMEALQRVKLDGFQMVISELEVVGQTK
jgi:hypothetical protein